MKTLNHLLTSTTQKVTALATVTAFTATILAATSASAIVVCDSPGLPPGCGEYRTPAEVHAAFENPDPDVIETILKDASHSRFFPVKIDPLPGGDELETFGSTVTGLVDLKFSDGTEQNDIPFEMTGEVQVVTSGKTGNETGTFETEMISMSLSGSILGTPFEVRESPTQPSLGQTTITPSGGSDFIIDSFFDIYLELSIDGGHFVPQAGGSARVELVPEPSTALLALIGLGTGAIAARRRRRLS